MRAFSGGGTHPSPAAGVASCLFLVHQMGRLAGRLWVGGTASLICFLWITPQLFIIIPAYAAEPDSSSLLLVLGPFNVLLLLLLYNYFLCVKTDPGGVPREWVSATSSGPPR